MRVHDVGPGRRPLEKRPPAPRALACLTCGGRLWAGFSDAGGIVPFNPATGNLEFPDSITGLTPSIDGLTFDGKYFWASDRRLD